MIIIDVKDFGTIELELDRKNARISSHVAVCKSNVWSTFPNISFILVSIFISFSSTSDCPVQSSPAEAALMYIPDIP